MRKVIEEQMKLGEVDISKIEFDVRSRDEIPQLLMGLQYIYSNHDLRRKVFEILEKGMKPSSKGRKGMDLWRILVLGVLRLNCDWDYDKLKEMADNHGKIREMLGHVPFFDKAEYPLQTLKDNIHLLTPELLNEINVVVVNAGQNLVKKKEENPTGRCDSFVLETNVHFPTDINLLWDSCRKAVELTARLADDYSLSGWRQSAYQLRQLKKGLAICNKIGHSTSKDPEKQLAKEHQKRDAYKAYITKALGIFIKVKNTLSQILDWDLSVIVRKAEIEKFLSHGYHQIELIKRRIFNGERIPHNEKIFSLFEPHTEWICKGKAGVPQELGIKVCIMEDQNGFLLGHHIMMTESDAQIAVSFTREMKLRFPNLKSCSYDKGFWSPSNKNDLEKELDILILPKKGRLSKLDKTRESEVEFRKARKQHSAVESGINALENHGLNRCPDHGEKGFRRYVSLAILGRNFQKVGALLQAKEVEREKRSKAIKEALAKKRLEDAA